MYENYFNLREAPFNLTPDPRFFFSNASVHEAFATLSYGIEQRKGLIVITGEAGTGKTTLIYSLLQRDYKRVRISHIDDPKLSFLEMMQVVMSQLLDAGDGRT